MACPARPTPARAVIALTQLGHEHGSASAGHGPCDATARARCPIGVIQDGAHTHRRDVPAIATRSCPVSARPGPLMKGPDTPTSLAYGAGWGTTALVGTPATSVHLLLPRILLLSLSIIGWGLALRVGLVLVGAAVAPDGEGIAAMGSDSYAYWIAGSHLIEGAPLYQGAAIDQPGAYFYPPVFAQVWAPLAMLPPLVVDWGWRVLGILSIRYMAGSWLMTGVWLLFPGAIVELTAGNVTYQLAAVTVAGLRGRAEGIPACRCREVQHARDRALPVAQTAGGSAGPDGGWRDRHRRGRCEPRPRPRPLARLPRGARLTSGTFPAEHGDRSPPAVVRLRLPTAAGDRGRGGDPYRFASTRHAWHTSPCSSRCPRSGPSGRSCSSRC